MSLVKLDYDTLYDIADAIRNKIESNDKYYPKDMYNTIRSIIILPPETFTYSNLNYINFYRRSQLERIECVNNFPSELARLIFTESDVVKNLTVDIDYPSYYVNTSSIAYFSTTGEGVYLNSDISNLCYNCSTLQEMPMYSISYKYVTNMSNAFYGCKNMIGIPLVGNNVRDMSNAYRDCVTMTGYPMVSDKVENMSYTYANCNNIIGNPVCSENTRDLSYAYYNCQNLTGSPVCGKETIDMSNAYAYCRKITGAPVCENNVKDFTRTYVDCIRLKGAPVCGDNVVDMSGAYIGCKNLIGEPVCGNNVTTMVHAYSNCVNLSGNPACGPNVRNLQSAYYGCRNIYGNMVINQRNCFDGAVSPILNTFWQRSNSNRLNIFCRRGGTWDSHIYNNGISDMCGGKGQTTSYLFNWTVMENGYYNQERNIYVYNNLT